MNITKAQAKEYLSQIADAGEVALYLEGHDDPLPLTTLDAVLDDFIEFQEK
jgi:hypothetical protein